MFKALSALFRSRNATPAKQPLNSAEDLNKGDMIKFADSFALPVDVRDQTFQVHKISTYFYDDDATPQYVIKSGTTTLYLTINDEAGEELIVLSKALKGKALEAAFGRDTLKQATRDESIEQLQAHDADSNEWLAPDYTRRVFGGQGIYYSRDLRHSVDRPSGGESFRYYEYYFSDDQKSVEMEVWEGDEMEAALSLTRPMTDIEEFWSTA